MNRPCPPEITARLRTIGGSNPYGETLFRVVWGLDRIVKIFGVWEDWQETKIGEGGNDKTIRLKSSVTELRDVPKYEPRDCWHLERWCPPEDYGSPEKWYEMGKEVVDGATLDTAGPFPSQGDYELCFSLTDSGLATGRPIPLISEVVEGLVRALVASKNNYTYAQRRAAIDQQRAAKDEAAVKKYEAVLRNGLRPFQGEAFVTVPHGPTFVEGGKILRPN